MRNEAAFSRRTLLLATPALIAASRAVARDDDAWPPRFETGRSQFTVVRPRAPSDANELVRSRKSRKSGSEGAALSFPWRLSMLKIHPRRSGC